MAKLTQEIKYKSLVLLDDGTTGAYCAPQMPCIGDWIEIDTVDETGNRIKYQGLLGMILHDEGDANNG